MVFEDDYIMRIIRQLTAGLFSVLLGKKNKVYELPLENLYESSDGRLRELMDMVNNGKINDAENALYERMNPGCKEDMETAILFYSYLNKLDDDYLEKYSFSREEIEEGLRRIACMAGLEEFADILSE